MSAPDDARAGLRLDSLTPVPDHVDVGHADEPVHGGAREAAFAEELLLESVLVPHPQRTPAGGSRAPGSCPQRFVRM